jgi:phenylacetate-CoA ligase
MNPRLADWLYWTSQRLRGEPVASVLRELEESQRWPADRLIENQWRLQREIARHAFETVPFYRERWKSLGFESGDLRSPSDWARLPALEKHEVRARGDSLLSERGGGGLKAATSGTSGTPVAVLRSHLSWAHAHANVFRGWRWHGVEVGDRYAYFWGLALDDSGQRQASLRDFLFNRTRLSAFAIDAERARAFYDALLRRPAAFGFGYPSAVTAFAEELNAQKLDGRRLGWKAVITTAEVLRPHQRERLAETFGCAVVDSYGCAEVGVTGFQCEHSGMHVPVESVVIDLVPTEDGRQEALLTDLHNRSQPIIRYRIGDLIDPGPDCCPCGRALPLLGTIQGRAGERIQLPDGRSINGLLPYYIFRPYAKTEKVREYQFVQRRDAKIELRVLAGPAWSDEAGREIESEVTRGLGLPVELKLVERIQRVGRGKHRDFVKSEDLAE